MAKQFAYQGTPVFTSMEFLSGPLSGDQKHTAVFEGMMLQMHDVGGTVVRNCQAKVTIEFETPSGWTQDVPIWDTNDAVAFVLRGGDFDTGTAWNGTMPDPLT